MKALKIWLLKRKAKRAYQAYVACLGNLECGEHLAAEMGLTPNRVEEFNSAMNELAKFDPNTPTFRL